VTKIESFKIQDGGDSHLESRFLVLSHRPIVRFRRNFVWGSRTACRQRPHKKLQIFKIQDGGRPPFWKSFYRHISVKNLPISMKFDTQHQILNPITVTWPKIEFFFKFEIATAAILKIVFWPLLINRLSDISEILHQEAERHADKGRMTKTAIFQNPRWQTAAILKIVKSPYLSETIIGFWQNLVYYSIYWTWWGFQKRYRSILDVIR